MHLFKSRFGAIFCVSLAVTTNPGPVSAAAVSWIDATGFWDVAANWGSNPALPGPADDVTISVAGLQTITHRNGTNTIQSLSSAENLAITGGLLTVSGVFSNTAD